MSARRPLQLLGEDRNTNFIRRFTQREEQRRVAKQPAALTPNHRAALRKKLEDTEFLQPDYADKTKINIAGLLRKWKRCTPLRWKEEWLKRPVFRRHEDSVGYSDERKYQPLSYQKLHDDMERQSLDDAEENAIEPKAWRRGAANVANAHKINEKVRFHLQNTFLDEPTEDSPLAMLSYIGLMRDPRASKDMVPDDVWKIMLPDPEIETLEAEKAQLKGGQCWIKGSEHEDRIRELTRLIAAKVARRRMIFDELTGKITFTTTRPEILCNQPDNSSSSKLLELRILAAELMVALCGKRNTVKRNRIQRRARVDVKVKDESPRPDIFPLLMDKKQCLHCIGDEIL
ncbi:hypothetical protein QBC38DRAFT_549244 [Podospora fimiseda]|uniref:Uncharacterized protein n=1 Tax=Podospora fimiseda TaxID=252190 RepID=A0AAN6YTE9_9PEZI|nr:hypothetical protein QBC38DRAFT_549244 [Podospora fimiseda]